MLVEQMPERCELYGDVNAHMLINNRRLVPTFTLLKCGIDQCWLRSLKLTRNLVSPQL